jgi:hypothetical protein
VPVRVRVGEQFAVPVVGEIDRLAAETLIVVLRESVVSLMVSVPVLAPVVMSKVWLVAELFVLEKSAVPVTPETVKLVLPFHDVPVPVQATEICPLWLDGIVPGEQVKLAVAGAN